MTVSANRNPVFRKIIDSADMAVPDGAPVAWMLRGQGFKNQPRIAGPDLMLHLLKGCAASGIGVYFYGSTERVLSKLHDRLRRRFPGLQIAGLTSPPFRPLRQKEDLFMIEQINNRRPGIVFVGLGCPKQEQWIYAHVHKIDSVMVGVGAAFDFHAGTIDRAPRWLRGAGLEWCYRLLKEPKRLWKRYLTTNSQFVILSLRQLLASRK